MSISYDTSTSDNLTSISFLVFSTCGGNPSLPPLHAWTSLRSALFGTTPMLGLAMISGVRAFKVEGGVKDKKDKDEEKTLLKQTIALVCTNAMEKRRVVMKPCYITDIDLS